MKGLDHVTELVLVTEHGSKLIDTLWLRRTSLLKVLDHVTEMLWTHGYSLTEEIIVVGVGPCNWTGPYNWSWHWTHRYSLTEEDITVEWVVLPVYNLGHNQRKTCNYKGQSIYEELIMVMQLMVWDHCWTGWTM